MQTLTQILDALLACIDWMAALNRWQLTALSVAVLAGWLAFVAALSRFFAGGYAGDRTDDEEDAP